MAVQQQLTTAEDLWEIHGASKHLELVRGVPVEMSPTGEAHGVIALWLGSLILQYVEQHNLGQATGAESGFILARDPDTVRAPDIAFIAQARLTEPTTDRYFPGPPDLAVEIVSPNDTAAQVQQKVMDYLAAGTRLVWVVYPATRSISVHHPDRTGRTVQGEDTLDGGDVLPGFRLPVSDVFKKLRE